MAPALHPALACLAAPLALAACVPPPATPTATPTPSPAATPRPPAPVTPAPADWRDAPVTPGAWRLGATSDGLRADYASLASLRCVRADRTVVLTIAGTFATSAVAIGVTTERGRRAVPAQRMAGGLAATVPARDGVLDAMAFSRGRFRLDTPDGRALVLPSWAEISGVIEDCR